MSTSLVFTAGGIELISLNEEDHSLSYARLQPWIAQARGRMAVGAAALQLLELEGADLYNDPLGVAAQLKEPPAGALGRREPQVYLAALLMHLRKEGVKRGFDPEQEVTIVFPDGVENALQTAVLAAEAAGFKLAGSVPFSVAASLGASPTYSEGDDRLVCVLDEYGPTIAIVAGTTRKSVGVVPGLGSRSREASLIAMLLEALDLDLGVMPVRRKRRIHTAAEEALKSLDSGDHTASLTLNIGERVIEVRVTAAELKRRLALELEQLRKLAYSLGSGFDSLLLCGSEREVYWVEEVLLQSLPTINIQKVAFRTVSIGCAKALAASPPAAEEAKPLSTANRIGMFAPTDKGVRKFDVIFDSIDPRERSVFRSRRFEADVTVELFALVPNNSYERLGAVRFAEFDNVGWPLELQLARKGSSGFSVQVREPRTGHVIVRELAVQTGNLAANELAAAAADCIFIPPLPPDLL